MFICSLWLLDKHLIIWRARIPFLVPCGSYHPKKQRVNQKNKLLFSHEGTKTQRENEYTLNIEVFSLLSVCRALMRLMRIKQAITKNNSIMLVAWCLCGNIPELQK